MAIHVALNHKTFYKYDRLVSLGPQIVRLRPAPHCRTPILSYSLKVEPKQHFLNWQQDPQSNYLARFVFPEKTDFLSIEVDLVAEISVINPFDFFLEPSAEQWPFEYEPWLQRELRPYMETTEVGPKLEEWVAAVPRDQMQSVNFVVALNQRLQQDIGYVIRMEPGIQTPEETLTLKTGSCRDSAWLLVQIMRNLGLAARFVSGYLIQLTADQKSIDGPSGTEVDFTDLHAWTEVYLPGAGWIGLDPTSGLLAGEGHIPLACTPDASSAAPITGAVDEAEVEFGHEMSITRIYEAPRVTKPYTDSQWGAIEALGHKIDIELDEGDVRLTMGGEPTFVSIDDAEGAEWNTAAVGPTKRAYAANLLDRLMRRFAPGGLVHYGQGKWYPGESLPRWALTIYWRQDGDALWANSDLLAKETVDYGFGTQEAGLFLVTLAKRLGIDPSLVLAAYEDPWHYLRKESQLPVNVDPLESHLEDKEERARLAKVFQRGLNEPVGFALPINRRMDQKGPVWLSSTWPLRQERLLLAPGDSSLGYRLPLGSLPWVDMRDYPFTWEQDPFDTRGPLPPHAVPLRQRTVEPPKPEALRRQAYQAMAEVRTEIPEEGKSAWWIVRTAMCCEARDGKLYVFMPPMSMLEDYLALVGEIEATALELNMPVIMEGYPPPRDPRLNSMAVTPDPGVIEVNIHPSHSWDELVRNNFALYEEARLARLGTEKFMLDGRHVGTGGGNHVVVGGATPNDSPFLRRPGPAAQPDHLLAEPPGPVLHLLRAVHRPDQSGAAHRRGAQRFALRTGNRLQPDRPCRRQRLVSALADRPRAAPPADRHAGQYPPGGVLHRQALFARQQQRPAGSGGVPGVRDAAACPDEPDAAASDAGHDRPVLEDAVQEQAGPLGHRTGRPVHAAAFRPAGPCRRAGRHAGARLRVPGRVVRPALQFPLCAVRRSSTSRHRDGDPAGAGALARPGRGAGRRRHGKVRGQLGRAGSGQGQWSDRFTPLRRLQRPPRSAASHGR